MNILSTKSWHVRNQYNKDRVRRDEENARLEEKKEQDRIGLAEKEARISYLRKKNTDHNNEEEAGQALVEGHFNLFSSDDQPGGEHSKKDNVDYVKEQNAEKETYEKKVGLLTYVGQSAVEAKNEGKLWYAEAREKTQKRQVNRAESSDSEVDEYKKSKLDPMAIVEEHTKHKRSKKEHKKKKKKKDKEKPQLLSSSKSIAHLREERLNRERIERQRTNELLNKNNGADVTDDASIGNDRTKYYNQFHPNLARKKRDR